MKVCYFLSTQDKIGGANISFLELYKGIKKKYEDFECIVIMSKKGTINDELCALGIKTYIIPFARAMKAENSFKTLRNLVFNSLIKTKIKKVLLEERITIIHNNSLPTTIGMEVALSEGIPYICHIRENVWDGLGMDFYSPRTVKRVLKSAYCNIVISEYVKKAYENFQPNCFYRVIKDGIDLEDYYLKNHELFMSSKIRMFIAGTINPQKGQLEAIESIEVLQKRGIRNIELIIAGRAVKWRGSQEYADMVMEKVSIHDNIIYVGQINDTKDMKELRSTCDINLVCSNAEGLGRITIESMLSGALTIAANAGATPEIISHRETGLLYPCGKPEELANMIQWAINNHEESRQIAKRGQQYAMENFNVEQYAKTVYSVYEEIVS